MNPASAARHFHIQTSIWADADIQGAQDSAGRCQKLQDVSLRWSSSAQCDSAASLKDEMEVKAVPLQRRWPASYKAVQLSKPRQTVWPGRHCWRAERLVACGAGTWRVSKGHRFLLALKAWMSALLMIMNPAGRVWSIQRDLVSYLQRWNLQKHGYYNNSVYLLNTASKSLWRYSLGMGRWRLFRSETGERPGWLQLTVPIKDIMSSENTLKVDGGNENSLHSLALTVSSYF